MVIQWNGHGHLLKSNLTVFSAMAIAELDAKTKSEAADAAGKSAVVVLLVV